MVRRAYRQRSLLEVLLPDGDKLWDPALRRIDAVLEDDALVDIIVTALARRHPLSSRKGRLGTPATVVLRMLVLKHLYHWSFDECEREVRGSLVYRAFCRIDCERVPDAKTLIRLSQVVDGPVLKDLLTRLVQVAREQRVIQGQRLRVDTTVVETNVHYPTDSTLLADGVRVLTRTLKRLGPRLPGLVVSVRDRARSVGRRVFAIGQRTRTAAARVSTAVRERSKAGLKALYQELMGITRAVVRDAERVAERMPAGPSLPTARLAERLRTTVGLVRRVLAQTRARILRGETRYPDKVVSPLRATHRGHPQGQGGQAHGVRQARQDSGGRGAVHHRLPGLFYTGAGHHPVGAGPGTSRAALRPAAALGGRRRGLRLPRQRAARARAQCASRGPAAAAPRTAFADRSSGPALANRLGRADQRAEAPARPRSVPLSRPARHGAMGRLGDHRQRPARARARQPRSRMTRDIERRCSGRMGK
jgi:IS5 family transposase